MKNMKKMVSMLLMLIMVLAMGMTALADEVVPDTYTITIKNTTTGHTYEAYQIFTGDLSVKGDKKVLSNIQWGSGITEEGKTAFGDAALKAEALNTTEDAKAFAKAAAAYLAAPAGTSAFTEPDSYTISNLAPGYYLVKDQNGTITGDDTYTGYILEVVGDVTAAPKGDKPEVVKKVDDVNDSTDAENSENWQDSADYDIGDAVPFQLTGTLPENFADYDSYTYIFYDTLSKGLTYNKDAKVYVVNGADRTDVTSQFTITTEDVTGGETTLTVSCTDLKKLIGVTIDAGSEIVVEYTATLNENANIGSLGNPNEVYLEYSNNPNNGGDGDTGKTPEDVVIVFTFKTVINKIDGDQKPLTGAEFTLEKYYEAEKAWQPITVVKNEAGTVFTFSGLDDGFYRLTETKTPDGYNTIDPIYFTITAEHEIESDHPALISLNGKQADEDGEVLQDGITFTPDQKNGSLTTDVVNQAGVELPSTGGIGTTIFYIVGALLMLVAAVLLITKKKMSAQDR